MRILFATDGSPGAADALALILSSFRPTGVSRVEVVTVVPPDIEPAGPETEADRARTSATRATAQHHVERAVARLVDAGFPAVGEVLVGHVADRLIGHAGATGTDLIVVGTRGSAEQGRSMASSVSSKVVRYATTSVLVADRPTSMERIVVGADGSPEAAAALDLVAELPLRTPVHVTVATAYDILAPLHPSATSSIVAPADAAWEDALDVTGRRAAKVAEAACRRLTDRGVAATSAVVRGRPVSQLTEVATEVGADVIAVGHRGMAGIERFLLGSTSAALVETVPTNVLVARRSMARVG
jgi:nucleotide-binding universal stress UspA family protein